MAGERLYLYDTTLRNGARTQGVAFRGAGMRAIAKILESVGRQGHRWNTVDALPDGISRKLLRVDVAVGAATA